MKKVIVINENKLRKILRESIWDYIGGLPMEEIRDKWNSEYEEREIDEYGNTIKRRMTADGNITYIYKKRNPTTLRIRTIGICYDPHKNEYPIAVSQDTNDETRHLTREQIFRVLGKFFPDFKECQGYAIELFNHYKNK